jgi:hypothetical protein
MRSGALGITILSVHVTLNHTHSCTLDTPTLRGVCIYTPYAVTSCSSRRRGFGFVLIEKFAEFTKESFGSTRVVTENTESF